MSLTLHEILPFGESLSLVFILACHFCLVKSNKNIMRYSQIHLEAQRILKVDLC